MSYPADSRLKDLGVLVLVFLVSKFHFSDDAIIMSQSDFILCVVDRCNMNDVSHDLRFLMYMFTNSNAVLSPVLDEATFYRQIIVSLSYIMMGTVFIITKLSQYMNKPTFAHLASAKKVLRYL